MNNRKKTLALLLALLMGLSLIAGCAKTPADPETPDVTQNPAATNTEEPKESKNDTTPLVVGYSPFSSKFSPFFAETAYDVDVYEMTAVPLLNGDRTGAIIMKGIEGETVEYNGTAYTYTGIADATITENADGTVFYDFVLRDDVTFSDGEPLTVDDVIFSIYVYCDPAYDGSSTLFAQPIEGMEAYRSGMSIKWNLIFNDGPEKSLAGSAEGYYTAEEAAAFWEAFGRAGEAFAQEIVDYCIAAGYGTDVATAAAAWGFEGLAAEATAADFFQAILDKYGYDLSDDGINHETAGTSISSFITSEVTAIDPGYIAGVQTGESAPSITGVQKTGDNSLRIVLTKVDATAIYSLAGIYVSPLHYYGDEALYDYENNSFGFPKGDLTIVRKNTTQPMGAGPYKFIKFENGVVSFEANEAYYKGAPKIKYINFLETQEADKLNGVVTGTVDITDPSFSVDTVSAIEKANGGELNGSVVTVNTVDNLGYGYIGMNAKNMSVGGEPASEASKNLRKAFGTIFSVYREVAIDSYYGERASVINYPISNTSWAAPQPADDGYKVAFSTDVTGADIYTSGMSADERYAAAKTAALGFLEAAGYTVADGKVTAAPEGAKLEYELWIPGDGVGDHPSFMICTLAAEAFKEIGINLIVTDLTNSSELWTALEAEQLDMWAAAWQATVDPDMYQIYFSGDDSNAAGGSNYMYAISDPELNQLILDARASLDQTYRKAMYKACLDIVIDWAVEIPVYQRQNAIIFSTERVDMDTVTPDITTFYGWMMEIENTSLK